MFIAIHVEVSDDEVGKDIVETLERMLPYFADNVSIGSTHNDEADGIASLVFPRGEVGTDNDGQYVIYTDTYTK